MTNLNDLAARVEALTGPDREVDLLIMRFAMNIGGPPENARPYTASIDAAMTLVPEECTQPSDIVREALRRLGEKFGLHISHWPLITPYPGYLARFVTAAALKARARSRVQGEG